MQKPRQEIINRNELIDVYLSEDVRLQKHWLFFMEDYKDVG